MKSLLKVIGKLNDYAQTFNGAENYQSYPNSVRDSVIGNTYYGYAIAGITVIGRQVWLVYHREKWLYL